MSLTTSTPAPTPTDDDMAAALTAFTWFLGRAAIDGIELTSAGYLKPADVEAASEVVPAMRDWPGKNNRENLARPLLHFRKALQQVGLLRKNKDRLQLTRAGSSASRDPRALWNHLATRIGKPAQDRFEQELSLLLLAYAASSRDGSLPVDSIAWALDRIGWKNHDRRPIEGYQVYHYAPLPLEILMNVDGPDAPRSTRRTLSPAAIALARTALFSGSGRV